MSDLSIAFNKLALESLLDVLSRTRTKHEVCVLDRSLSSLINKLCPFLKVKEAGQFEKVAWLDDVLHNGFPPQTKSILIMLHSIRQQEYPQLIFDLVAKTPRNAKINLIMPNIARSLVLSICHHYQSKLDSIDAFIDRKRVYQWQVIPRFKILSWQIQNPILVEGDFLLLDETDKFGGIELYLLRPIEVVDTLSKAVVSLLFHTTKNPLKVRNFFAKGDHSALVARMIQDSLVPQHVSTNMTSLEQEYYREKLSGQVDLVVVERNGDFLPAILDQTTYHGVLDDFFGIEYDLLNTKPFAESIEPRLCGDLVFEKQLKDLNFAGVGQVLNKMAKQVQAQFSSAASLADLIAQIQEMVAELGNLTSLQDSVKRHTTISARIVLDIDAEYRAILQFENDVWDMDYRQQVLQITDFVARGYNRNRVLAALVCVAIGNDGVKSVDYEQILQLMHDSYGLDALFVLELLRKLHLIKVEQSNKGDFFSNFIPGSSTMGDHIITTANDSLASTSSSLTGITGAQNFLRSKYTLVNKFWNLHPVVVQQQEQSDSQSLRRLLMLISAPTHPSEPELARLVLNTLPGNTVPLLFRLVESLYYRDFLRYKPTNNLKRRPNWDNLAVDQMFSGETLDINVDDRRDTLRRRLEDVVAQSHLSEYLVVVLLGGVTRSELSCFKLLEQRLQRDGQFKNVFVVSNGILNHAKFFEFLDTESAAALNIT